MAKRIVKTNDKRKIGLNRAIYEGLRDEITTGKLRPGEVLSRRQIASRYGTSYIPVIEALVRLENSGLVEAAENQMARVRSISLETIESDYVLREACETQAIRLACQSATAAEIDDLYRLAEAVDDRAPTEQTAGNNRQGVLLHWRFHKRIAELSRFAVLVGELERIELLGRLQANWCFLPDMPDVPRCHSLLVDALAARDADKADALMREHVQRGLAKELRAYRMRALS